MKLAPLSKSSNLGTGPELGLAQKGESITSRPIHMLERHIAPKVLGGSPHIAQAGHGSHIRGLAETSGVSPTPGSMSPIPSGGLTGQ